MFCTQLLLRTLRRWVHQRSFNLVKRSVDPYEARCQKRHRNTSLLNPPRLFTTSDFPLDDKRKDIPVHILAPRPHFLHMDGAFLVALNLFPLYRIKRIQVILVPAVNVFTLVEPNPVTPIIAIMAASSSFTTSISSPSSLPSLGASGSRFGGPGR